MRRGVVLLGGLGLAASWVGGCGSRTALEILPADAPAGYCDADADCFLEDLCKTTGCVDGACKVLAETTCPSTDACSTSACDPDSGACVATPLTRDVDGDGSFAPLPGTRPGAQGSCGDDCDDTRAAAFPGGAEVCDGVDNDCDGIVDNGELFLSPGALSGVPTVTPVATPDYEASARRGIAFGDGKFTMSYSARKVESHGYLSGVDAYGQPAFGQRPVTQANAPSFGATIEWSGESFGAAWSDARIDQNYEIFFSLFDTNGEKLSADVRVTTAPSFSLHPDLLFDQGRFVVVFDDRREDDRARVYGQLIDARGALLGGPLALSAEGNETESPSVAATATRLGVAYTSLFDLDRVGLEFRTFDKQLGQPSNPLLLTDKDAGDPRVTAFGDAFLVTWDLYSLEPSNRGPGPAIWGALVSDSGALQLGPVPLTSGAQFARSHDVVSLGDRVILAWSDDFDGNYEIYAKVLDRNLAELEPRRRLTDEPADSVGPLLALSDQGSIGILFDDRRTNKPAAYFMRLGCSAPLP